MANEGIRKWLVTLRSRGLGPYLESEYTFVVHADKLTEEVVNKFRREYARRFTEGWLPYHEVVVVNIIPLEG